MNVDVLCLICGARFVTSPVTLADMDNGDSIVACCPRCGAAHDRPALTDDGLLVAHVVEVWR